MRWWYCHTTGDMHIVRFYPGRGTVRTTISYGYETYNYGMSSKEMSASELGILGYFPQGAP